MSRATGMTERLILTVVICPRLIIRRISVNKKTIKFVHNMVKEGMLFYKQCIFAIFKFLFWNILESATKQLAKNSCFEEG